MLDLTYRRIVPVLREVSECVLQRNQMSRPAQASERAGVQAVNDRLLLDFHSGDRGRTNAWDRRSGDMKHASHTLIVVGKMRHREAYKRRHNAHMCTARAHRTIMPCGKPSLPALEDVSVSKSSARTAARHIAVQRSLVGGCAARMLIGLICICCCDGCFWQSNSPGSTSHTSEHDHHGVVGRVSACRTQSGRLDSPAPAETRTSRYVNHG